MHIGNNNIQHNYTMANQQLIATEEQRDLGITTTEDLKCQKRTEKSCKTANRVLGFIASNFNYKSTELMLPLYTSLVLPYLEYAVQFWSPHLCRDIDKIERVQRKATKWFYRYETIATNNGSRTWNSLASYSQDFGGNLLRCSNIWTDSTNVSTRGLFHYAFNDRTRKNGKQ